MKKECCAWCRESLADNYCMLPTCKCHTTEQPCNHIYYPPSNAIGKDFCPKCGESGYFHDSSPVEAVEGWEDKLSETDFGFVMNARVKNALINFIRTVEQEAYERGMEEGSHTKGGVGRTMYMQGRSDALNAVEAVIEAKKADPVKGVSFNDEIHIGDIDQIFGWNACRNAILTSLQALRKGE